MWKSKRNVRIQYTPLAPSSAQIDTSSTDRLDDLVTYQSLTSTKLQTVRGIDKLAATSAGTERRSEWDWRGKGWLMIAGSHWEILGWGEEEGTGNKWVVTMFAKTLFTPAGVDVYSKDRAGLQPQTVKRVKLALAAIDDEDVKRLAGELFEVTIDDARND